jgi:periplasmic divalent cation tolerance protein
MIPIEAEAKETMSQPANYCLIMTTCADREEAQGLARALVTRRLAACVQISSVSSFYEWDQKIQHEDELLLLIKAPSASYTRIQEFIVAEHSYDLPEVIQLPIQNGLPDYLAWIDTSTG